jgi:thymidylate synthase (FAD)
MNEISRRYVDTPPEFYVPSVWRGRPVDKKQGSSGLVDYMTSNFDLYYRQLLLYEDMIREGVAPEQARMVLPQSMHTEWYWSGSLDAFANMVNLRCKPDAQEETRVIAVAISDQMREKFPVAWGALCDS